MCFTVKKRSPSPTATCKKLGKSNMCFEDTETLCNQTTTESKNQNEDIVNEMTDAVMVAIDRSGDGGELRIVTDPKEIKNIELEEQLRKRNVSR